VVLRGCSELRALAEEVEWRVPDDVGLAGSQVLRIVKVYSSKWYVTRTACGRHQLEQNTSGITEVSDG